MILVRVVIALHFGQRDLCNMLMMQSLRQAGALLLSVTGRRRYRAVMKTIMARCNVGRLFRFAHLRK